MADPFIGEIKVFAGNFAPSGWAVCDGTLLQIAQNNALFDVLGTTYGGDGITTFALPDLRGRAPMHPGTGPGLTPRRLGQVGGSERAALTLDQIPSHRHVIRGERAAVDEVPASDYFPAEAETPSYGEAASLGAMLPEALGDTGDDEAHENRQPFLALNYIIALTGIFPASD